MADLEIKLRRSDKSLFEATNQDGHIVQIDGPADIGGKDGGMRPMELLLCSLAGCSSIDVLMILNKQRQQVDDLEVSVKGKRVDAVPAVYSEIHLHFEASGKVDLAKLQRAADLSMEKYCSVSKMLEPTVQITHSVSVK